MNSQACYHAWVNYKRCEIVGPVCPVTKGCASMKTDYNFIQRIADAALPLGAAMMALLCAGRCSAQQKASIGRSDILSVRSGRFYLDGRPFAEISFNKFDLLWQLYDQLKAGKTLDEANPIVAAQDRALRNLHELGFKSIRIFALPWGPFGPEAYSDADKRKQLYAALDKMVDLCERNDIRLVWSLGAASFTDTRLVDGKWKRGEEQERELIANPNSRGRALLYKYIDETVTRYKNRNVVMMWEISNEVTLNADIGDPEHVYDGERMPTLKQVADFFSDVTARIKATDPLRLVNSGGSNMREAQWHLYKNQGWKTDTFEDQFSCFALLYGHSPIDVIDIHSYPNNHPGYFINGPDGKQMVLDNRGYMAIAARLKKPLMIGELGLQAAAKSNAKLWEETPNYFESYSDVSAAKPWLERTLNDVVDAGVPLSYWWTYQSDQPEDKTDKQHFGLSRERDPELIACIVAANKRLRAKLGAAQAAR